ncbi:ferrous iron transport protein B [Clostridium akagii]|uniref:ferrous iron transport protein B n=1 Tax=Clostridium akagii TaxID=91623 RepID=UPI00056BFECF|nr:ferrous iron transport protein B [Clostridium akagii]
MNKNLVFALAGNPNCGKTSLFNELTGARQHVGNWPGVTVEKKEGKLTSSGREITVVDLPGTYSLGAYSEDEVVARDFILKDNPDVVINVIDASNIERNLYLTTQILETGAKVILALNMMDEAENKKIEIQVHKLATLLNIPVIPTTATKGLGVKKLIEAAISLGETKEDDRVDKYKIDYGTAVATEVSKIESTFHENNLKLEYPPFWLAIKLLENDEFINKYVHDTENAEKVENQLKNSKDILENSIGYDVDAYIVDKRYEFIGNVVKQAVKRDKSNESKKNVSDKIDAVVTNKWLGIPIFAIIMFIMYQITMTIGNGILTDLVGRLFDSLGSWSSNNLAYLGAPHLIRSFVADGLIAGLGSVIGFTPMIFLMYLLISILEDTGYMARAAYVMDRFMNAVGLHGKTAVSLIIGTGCNVAGVMSTRTLESKKDRMIAILISPFMSCTARLAIYAVFASAFFSKIKVGIFDASGVVVFGLYVLGIVVSIAVGKFLSSTVFKGEESYFIMELPPYRIPTAKGTLIHMWEKAGAFVKKAGTVILGAVIVVWVLSNLPFGVEAGSRDSLVGIIGAFIAPVFAPAGFGTWQAGIALITGFVAKEAVVGTMATIYGVGEGAKLIAAVHSAYTPLSALSFMVFTLLYVPCVATIGAIKRETNSAKWAIIVVIYTCTIAWVLAVVVYQGGRLLGFN